MRLPLPKQLPADTRTIYLLFFALSVGLMLLLPRPYALLPLGALVAAPLLLGARRLPIKNTALYLLLFTGGLALMVTLPRPYPSYILVGLVLLSLVLALTNPHLQPARIHPQAIRPKGRFSGQHYVLFFVLALALMLGLPREQSSILLIVVVGGSLGAALLPRSWWERFVGAVDAIPVPAITIPTKLQFSLEIAAILLALFLATPELRDFSPVMRLDGAEFSYLINSGAIAADIYQQTGSIPLWNPFMGRGEPLFENPFSFVLNPLMTLPMLWFGIIQGPKIALLLHIALLGTGGWLLAYMIGLRGPGRLLLAVLLGNSGSVVGQIGYGFYQMALSQAYVPWVYAGLLGTIRRRERWPVGILIVASSMMIFAGTYWYVLPTAISAALLSAFLLLKRQGWRVTLDMVAVRRLLWAGALILGVTAARLLPQAAHVAYVDHPHEFLAFDGWSFSTMFNLFFSIDGFAGMDHGGIFYHYLLPSSFALLIVAARLLAGRESPVRWRLLIPALALLVFFTLWAQGGTPFVRWIYDSFRLLRQWRYTPRILAAAVPWLALILALCYDDALLAYYRRARESRRLARGLWIGILLLMLGGTALALKPILENWERSSGMILNYEIDQEALYFIREQRPTEFLPVLSPGFFRYYPYYEKRLRAAFGNPDYRPVGIESTIGSRQQVDFPPPYAFGVDESYRYDPMGRGYQPFPGSLERLGRALWENPHVPTYAFTVPLETLPFIDRPLMAEDVQPLRDFTHNIERIEFDLEVTEPGQALVVQEVAYPGWRVRLNGEITALQSLGGLLAVNLPDYGPAHIEFSYEPLWFYIGCVITVLGILVFAVYMLRLDKRR